MFCCLIFLFSLLYDDNDRQDDDDDDSDNDLRTINKINKISRTPSHNVLITDSCYEMSPEFLALSIQSDIPDIHSYIHSHTHFLFNQFNSPEQMPCRIIAVAAIPNYNSCTRLMRLSLEMIEMRN